MHPRLLTTPFFTLHTFGLLLASAYVAGFWWLMREGRREGLDGDALASLGLWAIAGAVIGAKALMIARALPEYAAAPSELFSLSVLTSAGDFYGGFIGADRIRDLLPPPSRPAVLAHGRSVRARHRARPGDRPDRLLHGG